MAEVKAKLAQVIDPRQLAFNAGSDAGIKVGDTIRMYREVMITDPETNEPLGGVRVPKLSLRVNFVGEKFCVAAVTDAAPNDLSLALSALSPRLKVTTSPGLARSDTIVVEIGEQATIYTSEGESS